MVTFPAFVQLVRLLGRDESLRLLGVSEEPDPSQLTAAQRRVLLPLLDARLDRMAAQLVEEAAASDDVSSADQARAFAADRIAGFRDLLTDAQAARLFDIIAAAVADWG